MKKLVPTVIFSLLFIWSVRAFQENDCFSSCGELQDISYPFRLKSDPPDCGNLTYELSCIDNQPFLELPSGNSYLVTSISYENATIEVVDKSLATGKCDLPFETLTASSFLNGYRFIDGHSWATFINCSRKKNDTIDNQHGSVPCLSQNNRFVYVYNGYSVNSLLASCSYITMVPVSAVDVNTVGDGIFQTFKDGFTLSWEVKKLTRSEIIRNCLHTAPTEARYRMWQLNKFEHIIYPVQVEYEFVNCIKKTHDYALYRYSIVFLVFFDIISAYLVLITLGRLIFGPLCISVFLIYELLKMLAPIDSVETFLRNQQSATPTRYAYTDIIAMTRHFKDQLGQGGFGTVYKGELPGGHLVAVKLLGKSNDNGEDFISEVSTIGTIHHVNVVRLVGFCSEGSHRAIVYEYMRNGSLDKYIFNTKGTEQKFTTEKLNEIALGIARGIDYLHRGCDMRILHFDIKPHNILLDDSFNPKVSDFGLAKLYPKDYSMVSAFAARGTIGYMAPELISRSFGLISYKSDVYSFGMLLLEMASGRRNFDNKVENSSQAYYPSWVYGRLEQPKNMELLDEIEIEDVERKLCKVGLWCIQMAPSARPSMMKVVEMLEGNVDAVDMPPKPFLFRSPVPNVGDSTFYSSFGEIKTIFESE